MSELAHQSQIESKGLLSDEPLEFQQLHWTELDKLVLRGSRLNLYPMLSTDMLLGKQKLQRFSQHANGEWQEIYYYVTYDRDYVIFYIRDRILTPLTGLPWPELQKLITEAYAPFRSAGRDRARKGGKKGE